MVSLGQHADVDVGDMLDQLASDARTRSILLYIESIESPRKFMSAARAAARNKPVIVVRAGRARAAAQPADADRVYDAAIARAGMLRVGTLQQMFLAAETLARFRANRSEQLAILTNGSGAGVLAADAAAQAGVRLCTLQPETLQRPAAAAGAAAASRQRRCTCPAMPRPRPTCRRCRCWPNDAAAPALLLIHAPSAVVPSAQIARALLPLAQQTPPRLMGCWLGPCGGGRGAPRVPAGRHRQPTPRRKRRCARSRCWSTTVATRRS